ncbi:hypothetical protein QBC39DRAFT_70235 [Podospora conica]|nr:hypothetical protein QBC39DRAFT_70235 [Schizothecium conicum]
MGNQDWQSKGSAARPLATTFSRSLLLRPLVALVANKRPQKQSCCWFLWSEGCQTNAADTDSLALGGLRLEKCLIGASPCFWKTGRKRRHRPQESKGPRHPGLGRNFFFEPYGGRSDFGTTDQTECGLVSSLGEPRPRLPGPRPPLSRWPSLAPHTCVRTWETRVDLSVIQQGSQLGGRPFGRLFFSTAISTPTTPSGDVLPGMRPPGIDRFTGRPGSSWRAVNAATKHWAETKPVFFANMLDARRASGGVFLCVRSNRIRLLTSRTRLALLSWSLVAHTPRPPL